MEIMANSDNVLRGGLTSKHIDVAALLKHTRCEGIVPEILQTHKANGLPVWFPTPVEDFRLGQLFMTKKEKYHLKDTGPLILLLLKGSVEIVGGSHSVTLKQGQLAAHWDGRDELFLQADQDTTLFLATSAIHKGE